MLDIASLIEGYGRELQDRAECIRKPFGVVLILADGAGGIGGGAEAAERVIASLKQRVDTAEALPDSTDWCHTLSEIDQELASDPIAGETTAVVLSIGKDGIQGASVGDSEAWFIGGEGYRALTRHQQRKPLLGSGSAYSQPFTWEVVEGTILVASDGRFKYAAPEKICEITRQPDLNQAVHALVEAVRLPSGALWDDISLLLCRSSP